MRKDHKISVWKGEGKKRLERLRCRRENNIKTDFRKHKVGYVYYIALTQYMMKMMFLVNMAVPTQFQYNWLEAVILTFYENAALQI
jgi:hypothetical protein